MLLEKILVIVNDYNMNKDKRAIVIPFTETCCYNDHINVCNSYCKGCDYYKLCEQTIER